MSLVCNNDLLARFGLVHLHADLCDFHGSGDDNLWERARGGAEGERSGGQEKNEGTGGEKERR